ncbi:hypothetical protein AB5J62_23360 [Amycolatopsis sp. cg5]|uniref:hypothetical protein n=1 Tax=Amycolatopsis sp. cg5 TaxID=3238802 RepID=UPI003523B93D
MLYLDKPIGPINGLMLFRDHADPDLFFYAPERPRLALNEGVPEFQLLIYRRDITDNPNLSDEDKQRLGGGFLAFTVDLGVTDAQLKEVKKQLAVFSGGNVKLTPIPFTDGTVRLSITKDLADAPGATPEVQRGLEFFEEVFESGKPSLIGFNRATFGVVLSHEGALLMEAALRSGISPIGVIYDLEYLGLRPAFDVKIHADYKRIYTHLETQFGVKAGVGLISAGVDIDLAWQNLRDQGHIKVDVVNFTDDADLRKQADAAFDWFKTELLKDFFKSSLEPPAFMKASQGAGALSALQSMLTPLTQVQQGPLIPGYGQPTTQAPTPAPPPTDAKSNNPSAAKENAAANPPGPAPAGQGAANKLGFGLQVGFSLKHYRQEELKERDFEYSMQSAVKRDAAPQGLFSTLVDGMDLRRAIKEVDLDSDFFTRVTAGFALGADLAAEKITVVSVNVQYPAEPRPGQTPTTAGFRFTPSDSAAKSFQAWLNDHKDLAYKYQIRVDFASDSEWAGDEPSFTSDWITTTARAVTVNPFDALDKFDLEILTGLLDPSIAQVQLELEYVNGAFADRRTLVLKPGESRHWRLRLSESASKVYRYRATYFLPGNVRYRTDWVTSEPISTESSSLVINSPFVGEAVVKLYSMLDPSTIIEAMVDLTYTEAQTGYTRTNQITVPGGTPFSSLTVKFPALLNPPAKVIATPTIVRTDGSVFEGEPTPVTGAYVLTDGVGVAHKLNVSLASGDLTGAGLVAVRVRLRGLGAGGDDAEVLFRPSAPTTVPVTLVQPGAALQYAYEVEGYTTKGLPRPGQRGETSVNTLIVGLPA